MRSIVTSQTSTGSRATHSGFLPADQRLCPPGARAALELTERDEHLAALCRLERRGVADVVQSSRVVVEPQQQRADTVSCLREPVATDDRIERAAVLHLHPTALPGQVRLVVSLGEHAVLPEAALVGEPRFGDGEVAGERRNEHRRCRRHRGQVTRRSRPAELRSQPAETLTALGERATCEIVASIAQQVEDDERGGDLARELANA
jgi:hypothetical protein